MRKEVIKWCDQDFFRMEWSQKGIMVSWIACGEILNKKLCASLFDKEFDVKITGRMSGKNPGVKIKIKTY